MTKPSNLNRDQWIKWVVATMIAGITMSISVISWYESKVYSRVEGQSLEHRVNRIEKRTQRNEDRTANELTALKNMVNKVYEILIKIQSNKN